MMMLFWGLGSLHKFLHSVEFALQVTYQGGIWDITTLLRMEERSDGKGGSWDWENLVYETRKDLSGRTNQHTVHTKSFIA